MQKKLYVVHGIKGGVGKSLMSSIIVDFLLKYENEVLIIESDGHVPDVAARYVGVKNTKNISSKIDDEESLYQLLRNFESEAFTKADNIVLNLPANSEAIDSCAANFVEVAHALNISVRTIYMIAESEDSARLASKSATKGLVKHSDHALGVINMHFGRFENDFYWSGSEQQKAWQDQGLQETRLQEMPAAIAGLDQIKKGALYSFTLPTNSTLKIIDRIRLREWLDDAHQIAAFMIDDEVYQDDV